MRLALLVTIALVGHVHAQETIDLHFYVRPPYMLKSGETQASGLVAGPAKAAFEKASVPFRWQQTPAKRQLVVIESGRGLDCGIGWYKTPEREILGKFTAPLYRDQPPVALARMDFYPREKTLSAIVANPEVRVVMKGGLSYGRDVVDIMGRAKASVQAVTTEQANLARMVAAGRADFMFSTQEEATLLTAELELRGNRLKVLSFSDIHAGATRHIFCSNKVSDETIHKLNAALSGLVAPGTSRARTIPANDHH